MTGELPKVNYEYYKYMLELLNSQEKDDGFVLIRNTIEREFPDILRKLRDLGETAAGEVLQKLERDIGEAQQRVELLEDMKESFVSRFVGVTVEKKCGHPRLDQDYRHACAKSPFGFCVYDEKDGPRHSPCIYCGVSKYDDEPSCVAIRSVALGAEYACRYCGTPNITGTTAKSEKKESKRWRYVNRFLICPVCWSWAFGRYPEDMCFGNHMKLMQYADRRETVERFSLMLEQGMLYKDGHYIIEALHEDNLQESPSGPSPAPGTEEARAVGCFCPGKMDGQWYRHKYCPYHGYNKTTQDIWTARDRKKLD